MLLMLRRYSSGPCTLLLLLLLALPVGGRATDNLPALGYASSYSISLHQERTLGQAWMRQFRAANSMYDDPLTQAYTESLLQRLASHNPYLQSRQLNLLLVDQRQLNAFAVPGNVVGINTGLFLFAPNEDEFASVVAHELAHLSQRHFARRVEAARGSQWTTLAGILAGILVASQGHGDAGMAAIAGTQAAAIQQQLSWSRTYEQEADRIGMETLVAAGYAPSAMPRMFEQMQQLTRRTGASLEFLMTHPLTESRVADAWARADQMASQQPVIRGRDYELIRMRLILQQAAQPQTALAQMQQETPTAAGQLYLQALQAGQAGDVAQAEQSLRRLVQSYPDWLLPRYLLAEQLLETSDWTGAGAVLDELLLLAPTYYPALYLQAEWHWRQRQWAEARQLLYHLTQQRPDDPYVWYQLAEAAGKAGHTVQLHQARAEYFQLTGRFTAALDQLDLALAQARHEDLPWGTQASLRERRNLLAELRQDYVF